MRFEPTAPRRRLISLTPLIDIVFILLVFFMLASSLVRWQSVGLDAPATAVGSGAEGAWLVRVGPEQIDLNAEVLDLAMLGARVAGRVARQPEQRLLVQAAPGVEVQRLVDVLDRLRDAGATRLTLLQP